MTPRGHCVNLPMKPLSSMLAKPAWDKGDARRISFMCIFKHRKPMAWRFKDIFTRGLSMGAVKCWLKQSWRVFSAHKPHGWKITPQYFLYARQRHHAGISCQLRRSWQVHNACCYTALKCHRCPRTLLLHPREGLKVIQRFTSGGRLIIGVAPSGPPRRKVSAQWHTHAILSFSVTHTQTFISCLSLSNTHTCIRCFGSLAQLLRQ